MMKKKVITKIAVGLAAVVILIGCGDTSPVAPTSLAAPATCETRQMLSWEEAEWRIELQVTEVQAAVFFSLREQTVVGSWSPELPFTVWKNNNKQTQVFVFTPDNALCASRTMTYSIDPIVCNNGGVFNPNSGEHGACEGR